MPGGTGVAAAPREPSIELPAPGPDAGVISSLGTELAPETSPWMVVSAIETDPVIPKPFSMAGVAKFVAGISVEPPGLSKADATLEIRDAGTTAVLWDSTPGEFRSDDNAETSEAGMVGLTSGFEPGAPPIVDVDVGTDTICKFAAGVVLALVEPKTDNSSEAKDTGTAETVGACVPDEANSDDNSEISDEEIADSVGVLAWFEMVSAAGRPTTTTLEVSAG